MPLLLQAPPNSLPPPHPKTKLRSAPPACAPWNIAKTRGVEFRAIGNEPGLVLEINRNIDEILLVNNYGTDTLRFKYSQAKVIKETKQISYQVQQGNDKMLLTVLHQGCTDDMSGDHFDKKVEVVINQQVLRGCGKRLQ
ncbi:MAG: hypothetical protein IPL35_16815 [Sphingobacteriales bacterium]|nr:hypothetical protein [Sphingobacteriales bacterium]